jgi:hypothetical protein
MKVQRTLRILSFKKLSFPSFYLQSSIFNLQSIITLITLIALITLTTTTNAQPNTIALGLEYKPIFPLGFLRTGPQTVIDSGVAYKIKLASGFAGGMVIRKSFSKLIAVEVGINYIQRKYTLSVEDGSYTESSVFHIVGYQIPISFLVFIQTGEKNFATASLGISPDVFASNVHTDGDSMRSYSARQHTFEPAIIANVGWEYRTYENGYFYIGAAFHGPFIYYYNTTISYRQNPYDVLIPLSGNYLTISLRYFFPPESKYTKQKFEETP